MLGTGKEGESIYLKIIADKIAVARDYLDASLSWALGVQAPDQRVIVQGGAAVNMP